MEGLVVHAADMAIAKRTHPAHVLSGMDSASFPMLISVLVPVGTEFG